MAQRGAAAAPPSGGSGAAAPPAPVSTLPLPGSAVQQCLAEHDGFRFEDGGIGFSTADPAMAKLINPETALPRWLYYVDGIPWAEFDSKGVLRFSDGDAVDEFERLRSPAIKDPRTGGILLTSICGRVVGGGCG